MRIWKSHPLLSLANGYLANSPQDLELTFESFFACLLSIFLVTNVTTVYILVIVYNPNVLCLLEYIINNVWLIHYLLYTIVSLIFIFLYSYITTKLDNSLVSNVIKLTIIIVFILVDVVLFGCLCGTVIYAAEPNNLLLYAPSDTLMGVEPNPSQVRSWLSSTGLPLDIQVRVWDNVEFWRGHGAGRTITLNADGTRSSVPFPASVHRVYPEFSPNNVLDGSLTHRRPDFRQH